MVLCNRLKKTQCGIHSAVLSRPQLTLRRCLPGFLLYFLLDYFSVCDCSWISTDLVPQFFFIGFRLLYSFAVLSFQLLRDSKLLLGSLPCVKQVYKENRSTQSWPVPLTHRTSLLLLWPFPSVRVSGNDRLFVQAQVLTIVYRCIGRLGVLALNLLYGIFI